MRDPAAEGRRWLSQAEYDLRAARANVDSFPALSCYLSQQAAEKALKALLYHSGSRTVLGHSVVDLLEQAANKYEGLGGFRPQARELDRFYIPTRYPNGLPGGIPAESFTVEEAHTACQHAEGLLLMVRTLTNPSQGEVDA
jgi:HEPN domain-containing protein